MFFSLFLRKNVFKGFVLMFSDDIFKRPRKNNFQFWIVLIFYLKENRQCFHSILASKVCTIFKVPTKNFTTHLIKSRNAKFFTDSKFWNIPFKGVHFINWRSFPPFQCFSLQSYVNVLWGLFKTCVINVLLNAFRLKKCVLPISKFCTQAYSLRRRLSNVGLWSLEFYLHT